MWTPFDAFWSAKYLNFAQKLPLLTTRHIFLESRHPKVTKNSYYVSSTEGSQKKASAHGLVGQDIQNCLNRNLFLVRTLENGLQAISSSTTNVLNLWKWHYLVFSKFLRKLGKLIKWDKAPKTVQIKIWSKEPSKKMVSKLPWAQEPILWAFENSIF